MSQMSYQLAIGILEQAEKQAVDSLREKGNSAQGRQQLQQIRDAIACLQKCEEWKISPQATAQEIPFSAFAWGYWKLLDHGESGQPHDFLKVDGEDVELTGLELIVTRNTK